MQCFCLQSLTLWSVHSAYCVAGFQLGKIGGTGEKFFELWQLNLSTAQRFELSTTQRVPLPWEVCRVHCTMSVLKPSLKSETSDAWGATVPPSEPSVRPVKQKIVAQFLQPLALPHYAKLSSRCNLKSCIYATDRRPKNTGEFWWWAHLRHEFSCTENPNQITESPAVQRAK